MHVPWCIRRIEEAQLDGLHLNKQTKGIVLLISEHETNFNIFHIIWFGLVLFGCEISGTCMCNIGISGISLLMLMMMIDDWILSTCAVLCGYKNRSGSSINTMYMYEFEVVFSNIYSNTYIWCTGFTIIYKLPFLVYVMCTYRMLCCLDVCLRRVFFEWNVRSQHLMNKDEMVIEWINLFDCEGLFYM